MKVVILAGGLGTRLSEETGVRPKPMVEIGGHPILWHIMKIYSQFGHNDFIVCLGYKGYMIKEFFANYFLHMSDVTIHLAENRMDIHRRTAEPWRVTLVDTGDANPNRRTYQADHAVSCRRGDLRADVWRRRRRHRPGGAARVPQGAPAQGHSDRGSSCQAVRRHQP